MRIAVAGGTGWVGQMVVDAVRASGHDPVVLARSAGVDLMDGRGLLQRLDGVDAVIDVSNVVTTSAKKSIRFFETASRNLLAAEAAAGVSRHVALSIVGVDRVDLGYYIGKRAQERVVAHEAPEAIGTTILRATQFHEFAAQMLARKGSLVIAPKMLTQPVAAREVAQELVEIASATPIGDVVEMAGPQDRLWMQDMVTRLATARADRRPILRISMPGKVGRALKGGDLLPTNPGPRGTLTFDDWLQTETHPHDG